MQSIFSREKPWFTSSPEHERPNLTWIYPKYIIDSTYTPDAGNMRSYRAPEVVSNSADELFQPELYDSMSSRHYGAPAASSMMRQGLYVDRSALTTSSWLDRSGTALVQGGTAAKKQI